MIEWTHWHTEPLLVGSILAVAWAYSLVIGPYRSSEHSFPKRQSIYFALGIISFYLTVGSPLDALGENFLFSAHMVQHNALMYICPPLLLLGLPAWLIDGPFSRKAWLQSIFKFLVHPLIAGLSFTLVFSLWHIPFLYEWALHDKAVHIIEHLTMLFVSLQVWWCIVSPSQQFPALRYGGQIVFVFLLMVGQTPLFAFLTFSSDVFYPTYAYAPRVVDLSPIQDQVLGGVVMKLANMFVSLAIMSVAFYKWAQESEKRSG
ncbi:cytochrome c oxidase assembly protein [Coraliomargarita sinensis]|uniref:Cytochrome c oxidase assembly protein n=1 Tax=Coraliomargarita sinensis TaxID=2174842 RepID=A0A317ZIE7_9BACT|nr:cytochrome c oxidase assembly protein [Coraliomargarita sinensis]PXA03151.1 cytochrome c oxidase assembly protein [Coraliomargarita sinensis]